MSAKDELQDLRDMLGEYAYIEAMWAMRINAARPVPRQFTRNWAWSREKVVSLRAYRRAADLERAGNGMGLR